MSTAAAPSRMRWTVKMHTVLMILSTWHTLTTDEIALAFNQIFQSELPFVVPTRKLANEQRDCRQTQKSQSLREANDVDLDLSRGEDKMVKTERDEYRRSLMPDVQTALAGLGLHGRLKPCYAIAVKNSDRKPKRKLSTAQPGEAEEESDEEPPVKRKLSTAQPGEGEEESDEEPPVKRKLSTAQPGEAEEESDGGTLPVLQDRFVNKDQPRTACVSDYEWFISMVDSAIDRMLESVQLTEIAGRPLNVKDVQTFSAVYRPVLLGMLGEKDGQWAIEMLERRPSMVKQLRIKVGEMVAEMEEEGQRNE